MHTGSVIVAARGALAATAADWIATAIADAIEATGRCVLGLTGGEAIRPVYTRLAERGSWAPWSGVVACFGDERCVPPEHPESNYRMADELLLRRVPIPRDQVLRMPGEDRDRDAAAGAYERMLPDPIDVLLLGMGEDGHTASLFPGAPQLAERDRRVVSSTSPLPPHERLTITPPVIASARRIAVIITGGKKSATVARALEGEYEPDAMPVQLARRGTWFLDGAAAAQLSRAAP